MHGAGRQAGGPAHGARVDSAGRSRPLRVVDGPRVASRDVAGKKEVVSLSLRATCAPATHRLPGECFSDGCSPSGSCLSVRVVSPSEDCGRTAPRVPGGGSDVCGGAVRSTGLSRANFLLKRPIDLQPSESFCEPGRSQRGVFHSGAWGRFIHPPPPARTDSSRPLSIPCSTNRLRLLHRRLLCRIFLGGGNRKPESVRSFRAAHATFRVKARRSSKRPAFGPVAQGWRQVQHPTANIVAVPAFVASVRSVRPYRQRRVHGDSHHSR